MKRIKEVRIDGKCIKIISVCGNIKATIIKSLANDENVIIVTEEMGSPGVYNISVDKMSFKEFIEEYFFNDTILIDLLKEHL